MPRDSVSALDRALRSIRFAPRPALEAEILLRARTLHSDSRLPSRAFFWLALVCGIVLLGALIFAFRTRVLNLGVTSSPVARIYIA